jgi:diaminopimelate epimerase
VSSGGRRWSFQHVSIGNPQCAIRVDSEEELAGLDLGAIGPAIEVNPQFPNRTNVSWYSELEPSPAHGTRRLRARIFERGVGETLASGTGASGAAVAYVEEHASEQSGVRVAVLLDGGELMVDVGGDLQVKLTGWARPVFEGRLSEDFEKELHATE